MSETAIEQYAEQPASLVAGLGNDDERVLKPSQLALVQKAEHGTPGMFKDTTAGFEFETIRAVPLAFYRGRVMYIPGSEFGTPPLCRSSDGINPVISDDLIRQDGGAGCGKCPSSQWKVIRGKKIKPPCGETMQFIFIDEFTEFVYRLNVTGTGIVPTRNVRDTLKKICTPSKVRPNPTPHFGYTVELSSTAVAGPKGSYHVLNYGPPKLVADKEAFQRYYEIWDALVNKKGKAAEADPVDEIMDGEYIAA